MEDKHTTRQSKQCGYSISIFDNPKSRSMVRLVRSEQMALSGLVLLERKLEWFWFRIYRVWWVPWWLTWRLCLYICEKCEMSHLWHTDGQTDGQWKVEQYSVWAESAICSKFQYCKTVSSHEKKVLMISGLNFKRKSRIINFCSTINANFFHTLHTMTLGIWSGEGGVGAVEKITMYN